MTELREKVVEVLKTETAETIGTAVIAMAHFLIPVFIFVYFVRLIRRL